MNREAILLEEHQALAERGYEALGLLGEGAFSRVLLVRGKMDAARPLEQSWDQNHWRISSEGKREREKGTISDGCLACKICSREMLGQREGELLKRMDHPLFPKFYEMWKEDGSILLLMEAVRGSSLEMLLKQRGAFTERQTARVGLELAAGLKYLHELSQPMLFRDVKPANILIRQDGRVKLLDLGCACRLGEKVRDVAGTPGYCAPEQLESGHVLTPACDVYGLGKTMQAMAGEGCGRKLARVIRSCIEPCPQERIPDMRGVMAALMPFAEEGGRVSFSQKKGFLGPRVVCEKNIWENGYKNS